MTNTASMVPSPMQSGYQSNYYTFPVTKTAGIQITSWKKNESTNPKGNECFVWVEHNVFHDYAESDKQRPPENVQRYDQFYRYGNVPGWIQCREIRNVSGCETQPLYTTEDDGCSDGLDPNQLFFNHAFYYGAQTNTFSDGPRTIWDSGFRAHPFVFGRNALRKWASVEGEVIEGVVQAGHHPKSNVRAIFDAGPGVRTRYRSGTGNGDRTTWHSLDRVMKVSDFDVIGVIEVDVDNTTMCHLVIRKPDWLPK